MKGIFESVVEGVQKGLFEILENPHIMLMQLIATILLFLIIRVFFWKPITKFIEDNQKATNRELLEAHDKNKQASVLKAEVQKEYETARDESKSFKALLQQEAYDEKDRIIGEARAEAKRRLDQVEFDVRQEIKKSNEKIKSSIKTVAFAAAEKILQHEIDEDTHEKMIDELIDEQFK